MILYLLYFNIISSDNFIVYYPEKLKDEALHSITYLEKYKEYVDRITGGNPGKVYVFIEDIGVSSNAYADPLANSMHFFTNIPYPDPRFGTMRSWFRTIAVHEYTHISHLTNVGGFPKFLRFILGRIVLPHVIFNPLFMIEGITVFNESSIIPYEGRLNEGYYDAYKKKLSQYFKIPDYSYLSHLPLDYPYYSLAYLLGGEFTEYLSGEEALKYDSEKPKLAKYYSDFGKDIKGLINYDFAFKRNWKKSRIRLYYDWRAKEYDNRKYLEKEGILIDKSSFINFVYKSEEGIYYYRERLKNLSFDYVYYSGELIFYNKNRKKKIFDGFIGLPVRMKNNDLYIGISEVSKGGNNTSNLGFINVIQIVRLKNGKMEKIIKDKIKTFDVYKDKIFFSIQNGLGSIVYSFDRKKKEIFFKSDSILVQDMVFDSSGNLYFIGFEEGDGNNIFIYRDEKIERITDYDFSFSGLSIQDNSLFFSANYENKWNNYRMDLKDRSIYRILSDDFGYSPVKDGDSLYFITIDLDGEILKKTSYEEEKIEFQGNREKINIDSLTEYKSISKGKGILLNLLSMVKPDFILPYFYGIFLRSHDASYTNFYSGDIFWDSTRIINYTIDYEFRGIPYSLIDLRLSSDKENTIFLFSHYLFMRNNGFLRGINLKLGYLPFNYKNRYLTHISANINPSSDIPVYLYSSYSTNWMLKDYSFQSGIASFIPSFSGVMSSLFQLSFSNSEIKFVLPSGDNIKDKKGYILDVKWTKRLFSPNFGIDFPHFFLEKIYFSTEFASCFSRNDLKYNLLFYNTFTFSIFREILKLNFPFGIGINSDNKLFYYVGIIFNFDDLKEKMNRITKIGKEIYWENNFYRDFQMYRKRNFLFY